MTAQLQATSVTSARLQRHLSVWVGEAHIPYVKRCWKKKKPELKRTYKERQKEKRVGVSTPQSYHVPRFHLSKDCRGNRLSPICGRKEELN
ncbi:hypothetical protein CEXT_263731 [Caerostris extrusa]|uniref:Uncharacterized protein n=1 Tax=Caerostris extrusa TaxID=172846 RepID=A0AAV4Q6T9_CAEEX|nr:hypothetical protein CEXT_263731 [Caerostris extrusa]